MPAVSGRQFRLMAMIAHGGKSKMKGLGPSISTAKEFVHETPKDLRSAYMKRKKK